MTMYDDNYDLDQYDDDNVTHEDLEGNDDDLCRKCDELLEHCLCDMAFTGTEEQDGVEEERCIDCEMEKWRCQCNFDECEQ